MAGNTISHQIIDMLIEAGIKRLYAIPGDTIDSLMEALRVQKEIEFIIVRHEETAAFAATAEAKLTGNLTACMACQGPGANHLINGLYDAATDRAPVLAITGQVATDVIGTRMAQETNQIKLFDDFCVYNAEARSPANVPHILSIAIQSAISERSVAHISLPSDIARAKACASFHVPLLKRTAYQVLASKESLNTAAELLNKGKKVTILYGEGARYAGKELMQVAKRLNAPLVHTSRSKDIIDHLNPHFCGGIGFMGSVAGNHAMQACDTLLIVGSGFAFHDFYPDKATMVQLDLEANHIGMRIPVDHQIIGHAQPNLAQLLTKLEQKTKQTHLNQSIKKKEAWITKLNFKPSDKRKPKIAKSNQIMQMVNELASKEAIFCMDAGSVTVWGNNILQLNGTQRFIWCANLASLGTGIPYAIGCQLAAPKQQIIALCGDGGFQMMLGDLATIAKYDLPVIFVVFNNSTLRFIEFEEMEEGNPTFGTKLENPDYAMVAKAHGMEGFTIHNQNEIQEVLQQAFSCKKPCIVDAWVDPNELIIPPKLNAKMAAAFQKGYLKDFFTKRHDL